MLVTNLVNEMIYNLIMSIGLASDILKEKKTLHRYNQTLLIMGCDVGRRETHRKIEGEIWILPFLGRMIFFPCSLIFVLKLNLFKFMSDRSHLEISLSIQKKKSHIPKLKIDSSNN